MAILGVILLVLGLIFGIPLLFWFGLILILVGLLFWFGPVGGPRETRRRYY